MSYEKLKENLKILGLSGSQFSIILGHNTRYISNMKIEKVPSNISIIINLMLELNKYIGKEEIINIIKKG